MDMIDHVRRMAANNLWSNDRLYRAVLALGPGEFAAARMSFFPSIAGTLNHILAVDLLYLGFLEQSGGAELFDAYRPAADAATLSRRQAASDRRLAAFCERLECADLDRVVDTDRGVDGLVPERVGDLLAHLFLHQIHHRGQVHAMLAGTSVAPPQLDEFLLAYDRHLRRDEMRRLGLAEPPPGVTPPRRA